MLKGLFFELEEHVWDKKGANKDPSPSPSPKGRGAPNGTQFAMKLWVVSTC